MPFGALRRFFLRFLADPSHVYPEGETAVPDAQDTGCKVNDNWIPPIMMVYCQLDSVLPELKKVVLNFRTPLDDLITCCCNCYLRASLSHLAQVSAWSSAKALMSVESLKRSLRLLKMLLLSYHRRIRMILRSAKTVRGRRTR